MNKQDKDLRASSALSDGAAKVLGEGSKHTPGPWKADFSKYHDGVYIVQAQGPSRRVLASFDGDGDGYDPTDVANAHLIAAAPDLLAAAEDAIATLAASRHLLGKYTPDHQWLAEHDQRIAALRAAIAKASQS